MKDKLIYTKTYTSRRSNGANRAYWTKYIKSLLPNDTIGIHYFKMDSYDNTLPIFSYISFIHKRGFLVYQYEPTLVSINEGSYSKYMTAWMSQKKIEGKKISILTIYMISSVQNMEMAKQLIKSWYFHKRKVKMIIEKIYSLQSDSDCNALPK